MELGLGREGGCCRRDGVVESVVRVMLHLSVIC